MMITSKYAQDVHIYFGRWGEQKNDWLDDDALDENIDDNDHDHKKVVMFDGDDDHDECPHHPDNSHVIKKTWVMKMSETERQLLVRF